MFTYAIVKTDDTIEVLQSETSPDYDALNAAVGGWLEGVPLEGVTAYINEEGKLLGLRNNKIATVIAHKDKAIFPHDNIVGDMIVLGPIDDEGEETPLSLDWIQSVADYLGIEQSV